MKRKKSPIIMIFSVAILFAISTLAYAQMKTIQKGTPVELQKTPQLQKKTTVPYQKAPQLQTVPTKTVTLEAGGKPLQIPVKGNRLNLVRSADVVKKVNNKEVPVKSREVRVKPLSPTAQCKLPGCRIIQLTAGKNASGEYQVRLKDSKKKVIKTVSIAVSAPKAKLSSSPSKGVVSAKAKPLPLSIPAGTSRKVAPMATRQALPKGVVSSKAIPSHLSIRAGTSRKVAPIRQALLRVVGPVRVTVTPGGKPVRFNIRGKGLSKIASVWAVNHAGTPVKGIEVMLGPGTDIEKILEVAAKVQSMEGPFSFQFKLEAATGGMFIPRQVLWLDVGGGKRGGRPGRAGSLFSEGGAQVDRKSLASSFGLSTSDPLLGQDLSRSSGAGDSRLMEEGDDPPADDPPADDPPAAKKEDKKADTVVATSTDTTSSDGSQSVSDTVTVYSSDGGFFSHTMTHTTDSNGNVTGTQHAISRDSSGNVQEEGSCKGYACTPDPEGGGCTSSKNCEAFNEFLKMTLPMVTPVARLHQAETLKGDQREGGSYSGTRSIDDLKTQNPAWKDIRTSPYINPDPEGGGSSGDSGPSPGRNAAPVKDLKGTLPDPGVGGEPVGARPPLTLPPGAGPDIGGTGGGGVPEP